MNKRRHRISGTQVSCGCGSSEGPKLIYACSGCTDAGELSDQQQGHSPRRYE